jgi:hypothetical protein
VQVPYDEGVAIHIGPESCAVAREGLGEALTGVRVGQPLSRESFLFWVRTGGGCRTVDREISRFPRKERLHMPGSLTTPGRPGARADAPTRQRGWVRRFLAVIKDRWPAELPRARGRD